MIPNISDLDYKLLKQKYDEEELLKIVKKINEEDYPVQYAIGNVEFFNVVINVDERVLIPRFATELLVDKTIKYMEKLKLTGGKVIDLCTGSGAIAISLKKHFSNLDIKGYDVSKDALEVARNNAILNDVSVDFLWADILSDDFVLEEADVLISNPPYVRRDEIVSSNTKYEPQIALYPGDDELIFYKKILEKAKFCNYKLMCFEIGAMQGKRICDIAEWLFPTAHIQISKDYEGYDRYIFIVNE